MTAYGDLPGPDGRTVYLPTRYGVVIVVTLDQSVRDRLHNTRVTIGGTNYDAYAPERLLKPDGTYGLPADRYILTLTPVRDGDGRGVFTLGADGFAHPPTNPYDATAEKDNFNVYGPFSVSLPTYVQLVGTVTHDAQIYGLDLDGMNGEETFLGCFQPIGTDTYELKAQGYNPSPAYVVNVS